MLMPLDRKAKTALCISRAAATVLKKICPGAVRFAGLNYLLMIILFPACLNVTIKKTTFTFLAVINAEKDETLIVNTLC